VRDSAPNVVTVSVLATYPSNSLAQEASVYWKKVATFYSQQLIASLAGFGKTLRRMDFKPVDERIEVSFELNADQIRFILSYAEGRLRGSQTKKGP
jgi:nitrate reductase assembly molybdenum cofactor insertion protein NarJ